MSSVNSKNQVLVLSGGVGGAKLALGMYSILAPNQLTVMVNTGDDFTHLGLHICPDIDTTLYTLSGLANSELGWGRAEESWNCLNAVAALGGDSWFRLGDKDIALHLLRTQALTSGQSLSEFTQLMACRMNIHASILPMSDQPVATMLETDQGCLAFQDYFVRQQCQPQVRTIEYTGAAQAQPLPQLLKLLQSEQLRAIVIAPSNPFLSIAPILAMPAMRAALRRTRAPIIAVSPVIGDAAVKGPTTKIMRELQLSPSALAVATYYTDLLDGFCLDGFILDSRDAQLQSALTNELPELRVRCVNTLMHSLDDRQQLASDVLAFADQLSARKVVIN